MRLIYCDVGTWSVHWITVAGGENVREHEWCNTWSGLYRILLKFRVWCHGKASASPPVPDPWRRRRVDRPSPPRRFTDNSYSYQTTFGLQTTPKSTAAVVSTRTPLGELTALPIPLAGGEGADCPLFRNPTATSALRASSSPYP